MKRHCLSNQVNTGSGEFLVFIQDELDDVYETPDEKVFHDEEGEVSEVWRQHEAKINLDPSETKHYLEVAIEIEDQIFEDLDGEGNTSLVWAMGCNPTNVTEVVRATTKSQNNPLPEIKGTDFASVLVAKGSDSRGHHFTMLAVQKEHLA